MPGLEEMGDGVRRGRCNSCGGGKRMMREESASGIQLSEGKSCSAWAGENIVLRADEGWVGRCCDCGCGCGRG